MVGVTAFDLALSVHGTALYLPSQRREGFRTFIGLVVVVHCRIEADRMYIGFSLARSNAFSKATRGFDSFSFVSVGFGRNVERPFNPNACRNACCNAADDRADK